MNRRGIKRLEQLEAALLSPQRKNITVSMVDPVSGELVDFSRYKDLPDEGPVTFYLDLPPAPGAHRRFRYGRRL